MSFYSGTKDVTTAGTGERIAGNVNVLCETLVIQAKTANTTDVVVGGSDVDVNEGVTLNATQATANDSVELRQINLADVYVDAATSSEGVTFAYTIAGGHPNTSQVPLFGG